MSSGKPVITVTHLLGVSGAPAPSPCPSEEVSPIISYKDLVDALQQLERQDSSRKTTRTIVQATEQPSLTAKNDSDCGSFSQMSREKASDCRPYDSKSANTSEETLSPNDSSREPYKQSFVEAPVLVEFGTCNTPESAQRLEERNIDTSNENCPVPMTPKGRSLCSPHPSSDLSSATYSFGYGDATSTDTPDVYNWDPDPFACALYSPAQLVFFGDFLRSPFVPSPSPPSDARGISPFESHPHPADCSCERCFIMEVALNKDFREISPLAPWVMVG